MSFLGCVSQLGAVKVRPLSVPASYTVPASLSSSTQSPPAHRDTLLTPTNQSGDGTMRVMQEIWKNIFLFLEVKNICTLTLFLDPLTNIVDLRTPTPEVTGRTWTTSSPVSTMPDSTIFSSSDKLSEFSTKSLNSSPTTSPTQEKKKLNANNTSMHLPSVKRLVAPSVRIPRVLLHWGGGLHCGYCFGNSSSLQKVSTSSSYTARLSPLVHLLPLT